MASFVASIVPLRQPELRHSGWPRLHRLLVPRRTLAKRTQLVLHDALLPRVIVGYGRHAGIVHGAVLPYGVEGCLTRLPSRGSLRSPCEGRRALGWRRPDPPARWRSSRGRSPRPCASSWRAQPIANREAHSPASATTFQRALMPALPCGAHVASPVATRRLHTGDCLA
jgi:hypothetical protein